jgi:hypothetical protein
LLSLVGFFFSWSGDMVLMTTMLTFGLMLPIWFVAANLWWVLLMLMPAMILRPRGKGALGLVIGVGTVVVIAGLTQISFMLSRSALTPDAPLTEPGLALKAGVPTSVEIRSLAEQPSPEAQGVCGNACMAMFNGPDIKWLRLRVDGDEGFRPIVYHRSDTDACLALDPMFDPETACILARRDDATQADLLIEISQEGNFWSALEKDHGPVYLTFRQRLTLTDTRPAAPQKLDERLRYGWSEPMISPLLPGMTALGSGATEDGPRFARSQRQSPGFDIAAILAHSGVRLTTSEQYPHTGGWPAAPQGTALLLSVLELAGEGALPSGQARMASEWLMQFHHSPFDRSEPPKIRESERRVMQGLLKVQISSELENTLWSIISTSPEYFFDDFGELLRIIVAGTPKEADRATRFASIRLFRMKQGAHDANWSDYVAAVESGRADKLISGISKFNHDPVPVLRTVVARNPHEHRWVLAVCEIDRRWWQSLVPFVYERAGSVITSAKDADLDQVGLARLVRSLTYMERRDLAEDLLARLDKPQADKIRQMAEPWRVGSSLDDRWTSIIEC